MLETLQPFFQQSDQMKIWLTQVFIVVFATVSVNFLLMRVIDIAEKLVDKTESLWDDALLEAARIPVRLFIWTIGITFAVDILDNVTETAAFGYLPEVRSIAYIVILSMFFTRFISFAEHNIVDPQRMSKPMDQTTEIGRAHV